MREPRHYPPIAEVEALWAACGPLRRDEAVAAWVASMGLRVNELDARDVARALPRGTTVPAWARASSRHTWSCSPYRVLFPLYDADGAMRSLLARYIGRIDDPRPERRAMYATRAPWGHGRRGLALADADGVGVLRGQSRVDVALVDGDEGLCARASGATIALLSGSWSMALAQRVASQATSIAVTSSDWRITSSFEQLDVEHELEDVLAQRQRATIDEERRRVGVLLGAVRDVAKALELIAHAHVCADFGEPVCPACDLMVSVTSNGLRWACTGRPYGSAGTHGACGAKGDALDFLAFSIARRSFKTLVADAHGQGEGDKCEAVRLLRRLGRRAREIDPRRARAA
ncbi:MAG: hypothetical protein J0L92_29300 [Deltaproteobacteria bacterium]|nr:hypothetical protein [Deltaproteobacteria bacterium]